MECFIQFASNNGPPDLEQWCCFLRRWTSTRTLPLQVISPLARCPLRRTVPVHSINAILSATLHSERCQWYVCRMVLSRNGYHNSRSDDRTNDNTSQLTGWQSDAAQPSWSSGSIDVNGFRRFRRCGSYISVDGGRQGRDDSGSDGVNSFRIDGWRQVNDGAGRHGASRFQNSWRDWQSWSH